MAIVLDINFLCNRMLDIDIIVELLNDYGVSIKSINSIDNWMWDNEQKVECLNQVEGVLNDYRIVIIELKKVLIKDLGVYIEKIENLYLYTLWINTEGYQMLDCDKVTLENSKFYEEIFQTILKVNKRVENIFEVIGIGLETDFYYSENVMDTIQNSKNIVVWILNNHSGANNMIEGYKEKKIEGLQMKILEKVK